jgi:hypothetical protein
MTTDGMHWVWLVTGSFKRLKWMHLPWPALILKMPFQQRPFALQAVHRY